MGVIINLFVAPEAPQATLVADLVANLVAEGWFQGPWRTGPAYDARLEIIEPELAALDYAPQSAAFADHPDPAAALAAFRAADGPAALVWGGFDPAHPSVARDFDHYNGLGLSIAAYRAPDGHRLVRYAEGEVDRDGVYRDGPLIVDVTLREWLHFQGKTGVWTDLFQNSELARRVRAHWGALRVAEECYL